MSHVPFRGQYAMPHYRGSYKSLIQIYLKGSQAFTDWTRSLYYYPIAALFLKERALQR